MGERIALIQNSVARESSHRMFADEGKREEKNGQGKQRRKGASIIRRWARPDLNWTRNAIHVSLTQLSQILPVCVSHFKSPRGMNL